MYTKAQYECCCYSHSNPYSFDSFVVIVVRRRRRRRFRKHTNVVVDGYIDGVLSSTDWNEGKKICRRCLRMQFLNQNFRSISSIHKYSFEIQMRIFADILEFTFIFGGTLNF